MTIGIVAICESGKAIVACADRLAWLDHFLETELDDTKTVFPNDRLVLVGAGTTNGFYEVLARVGAKRGGFDLPVRKIASNVLKACQAERWKRAEGLVIHPNLGLNYKQFQKLATAKKPPTSNHFRYVCEQTAIVQSESVLVAGIDSDGAHLYKVNYREKHRQNAVGFAAVGSGEAQAIFSLASHANRKSSSVAEATYRIFEAKRRAELTQGVGKSTDIGILRAGAPPVFLDKPAFDVLESVYQRMHPPTLAKSDADAILAAMPRQILSNVSESNE